MITRPLAGMYIILQDIPKIKLYCNRLHYSYTLANPIFQVGVVVESVSNPLCQDLKSGDIVVMVEGKNVQSLSALNKVIKQCQSKVTLRVERKLKLVLGNEDKVNQVNIVIEIS